MNKLKNKINKQLLLLINLKIIYLKKKKRKKSFF